jgi:hypothetical protein
MNNLRIFLYKLLHKNTITVNGRLTDNELSFMIRNFIKNNKGYLLAYNINHIMNIIIDYPLSYIIILNFYRLTVNKNELLEKINEWRIHYKNDLFWKLLSYEQYYYLLQLKEQFNSIYDCAKCKEPFYCKLILLFASKNTNHEYIITQVIERLICILAIFDQDIFVSLQIPLITVKDFYKLPHSYIIKYIRITYNKITRLLDTLIGLFNLYNLTCIQLNNIINIISYNNLLNMNTVYYVN